MEKKNDLRAHGRAGRKKNHQKTRRRFRKQRCCSENDTKSQAICVCNPWQRRTDIQGASKVLLPYKSKQTCQEAKPRLLREQLKRKRNFGENEIRARPERPPSLGTLGVKRTGGNSEGVNIMSFIKFRIEVNLNAAEPEKNLQTQVEGKDRYI